MVLVIGTLASGGILGPAAAVAAPAAETVAVATTGAVLSGGGGAVLVAGAEALTTAAVVGEAAVITGSAALSGVAIGTGSVGVASTGAAIGAGIVAGEGAAATALAGGLVGGAAEGVVASVAASSGSIVTALLPATPIGWFVLGRKDHEQSITYDCWKPVLRDQTKCLSKGKILNIILNDKRVNNYYFTKYNNLINWELIVTNIFNDKFKITPVIVNGAKYAHASIVE